MHNKAALTAARLSLSLTLLAASDELFFSLTALCELILEALLSPTRVLLSADMPPTSGLMFSIDVIVSSTKGTYDVTQRAKEVTWTIVVSYRLPNVCLHTMLNRWHKL